MVDFFVKRQNVKRISKSNLHYDIFSLRKSKTNLTVVRDNGFQLKVTVLGLFFLSCG